MIYYIFCKTKISISVFCITIREFYNDFVPKFLKEFHDVPTSGHSGFYRIYKRIRGSYKWKNMMKDIANHIKTCDRCQKNKLIREKNKNQI